MGFIYSRLNLLGLDHTKALVHENCKRLIINLIVVLVCGGDRSSIAKALMDFQTVSCTALNRSASIRVLNAHIEEEVTSTHEDEAIAKENLV